MKDTPKGGFSQEFIERVIESIDVVNIVGRYTTLKKAGKSFKGLCPFHQEKTPSFTVDPDRGLFYCFGCGKGGNIISLVMEKEGLSFPEAIEFLAKEAGIAVPQRRVMSSANEALQQAIGEAFNFYHKFLFSDKCKNGIEYLSSRGISEKFAKEFGFGWAPAEWDSLKLFIERKKINTTPFTRIGVLIHHPEKGTIYDRFRGGLIIPIRNSAGRLVAFALRSLENDEGPKYINSPESPLYRKSEVLFGLDTARKSIRQKNHAILVEGYFDVLSLWRAGFENTVASCGTSFTNGHANLLARFTDTVIVFYDGDNAGLTATYRAIEPLLRQELIVKIARPPDGLDPDDMAKQLDAKQLKHHFEQAEDWFDFSVNVAKESGLWDSVEGKLRFADKIAPYISALGKSLTGGLYRKKLAEILGVNESQVAKRIAKTSKRQGQTRIDAEPAKVEKLPKDACIELDLIAMIISNPMLGKNVFESNSFVLYRGVVEQIAKIIKKNGECSLGWLADFLEPRALSYLTRTIINFTEVPTHTDVEELIHALSTRNIDRELDSVQLELAQAERAGDKPKTMKLLVKFDDLKRKKIELTHYSYGGN